jgi:hypothetical protein
MATDDRDVPGGAAVESECQTPMAVDAQRIKASTSFFERDQMIVLRYSQVLELGGIMQVQKLASRGRQEFTGKRPRRRGTAVAKQLFGQSIPEAFYHVPMLS